MKYAAGLEKMVSYGKQYGREVDTRETGVLIFTHINENKKQADEVARAFLSDFPTMSAEPLIARSAIGPAEMCLEKVQSYVDEGCSKFVLWPIAPPEQLVGQVETFGEKIVPQFA